jgi:beta-galactosidase
MKLFLTAGILLFLLMTGCYNEESKSPVSDLTNLYQKPSGKAETLVLACYKTTMIADGSDQTLIRVSVIDSTGLELLDANFPFQISVSGDGAILETDNSEPDQLTGTDSITTWNSRLHNGVKKFILKAGETPDKFKVEVKAESLHPASHEIHTISRDEKLLKPMASHLKPSPVISQKMIGADISFLPQLEARGQKFYDNGIEKDAIEILKDHGFNYIRLRIFVNPENDKGYSPGAGYCGLDSTLMMARRIKDAGLRFLLDFHYSDYWADPQQQNKPKAWESLPFEELSITLKEYTKSTLLKFKEQGTLPDMVQVGNEINHGIVWPDGHISNLDNLAELLKAGVDGINEVDSSIIVMMQVALGGQNEEAIFWFDNMIARGVQFDIIGLSYYPRWHCTLDDLYFNLNDMIKRYQKDVNVVEYSAFKREIHDLVFNLPDNRGNGTCIWEPLNTWSRVFDEEGNSLDEIKIYDEMSKLYLQMD